MNTTNMTELQKKQRAKHDKEVAEGKGMIHIPAWIAQILRSGNIDGYEDYVDGKPARIFSELDDDIYVQGYKSGYRMASKGKKPQCVMLREMGMNLLPKKQEDEDIEGLPELVEEEAQ